MYPPAHHLQHEVPFFSLSPHLSPLFPLAWASHYLHPSFTPLPFCILMLYH